MIYKVTYFCKGDDEPIGSKHIASLKKIYIVLIIK